jgi:hypothetical protein
MRDFVIHNLTARNLRIARRSARTENSRVQNQGSQPPASLYFTDIFRQFEIAVPDVRLARLLLSIKL